MVFLLVTGARAWENCRDSFLLGDITQAELDIIVGEGQNVDEHSDEGSCNGREDVEKKIDTPGPTNNHRCHGTDGVERRARERERKDVEGDSREAYCHGRRDIL